jgi:hypothetical protein
LIILAKRSSSSASVASPLPAVRAAMSRSFIAALTSLSVDMRRLSCALVACFKAAVMVSRMESGSGVFVGRSSQSNREGSLRQGNLRG